MNSTRANFMKEYKLTTTRNGKYIYERDKKDISGAKTIDTESRYKSDKNILQKLVSGEIFKSKEQKYITNYEDISKYGLDATDLQISSELYQEAITLSQEIAGLDTSKLTNGELSQYLSRISDMDLDLLKDKFANLTGMSTKEFVLQTPTEHGGEYYRTTVRDKLGGSILQETRSDYIDKYMEGLPKASVDVHQIQRGDVDRDKLEKRVLEELSTMEEIMATRLMRDGKQNITSYQIEKDVIKEQSEKSSQKETSITDDGR